ncbi:hypothetical protein LDENG_00198910 [Lucifuga dentata]|nr:hypothetical protein LDENG_00198910 [Lucifuga dentata]
MYFTKFVSSFVINVISSLQYSLPQFRCFQCSSYKLELLSNQIFHLCCLWVKKSSLRPSESRVNPLCYSSKWDDVVDCHIF